MAEAASLQFGKNTPFAEQLEFFRKKIDLPTDAWDDVVREARDRAFTVAGAAQADLLNDLHQAIGRAIEGGSSLATFRKDFQEIVQRHGWTGWTGQGTAAGEAWRTRVIYQTNMSTSYAAGRWRQLTNPALLSLRPYWKYVHSDGVMHPRPLHLAWNRMVLHHTHMFWRQHYPPNGWGCQCYVIAVGQAEYEAALAKGKAEPPAGWDAIDGKTGAPVGIDKGFDYAPGANAATPLADLVNQKLFNLAAPIGARMYAAMRPTLRTELRQAFTNYLTDAATGSAAGRTAVPGAMDEATLSWFWAEKRRGPATAEIVLDDAVVLARVVDRRVPVGPLTVGEWAGLPDILEAPVQILFDTTTGRLVYLAESGTPGSMLAFEVELSLSGAKGQYNRLAATFRLDAGTIESEVASGRFKVVKG